MIGAAILLAVTAADPLTGTWEGTSSCQVKPSACHDEHVLYRFTSVQPRRYRIDAYKLVAGQHIFMGPIEVRFDPATAHIEGPLISSGQSRGMLLLTLKGAHLSGDITLPEGMVYRLIEVERH